MFSTACLYTTWLIYNSSGMLKPDASTLDNLSQTWGFIVCGFEPGPSSPTSTTTPQRGVNDSQEEVGEDGLTWKEKFMLTLYGGYDVTWSTISPYQIMNRTSSWQNILIILPFRCTVMDGLQLLSWLLTLGEN